jgi:hypothetical protein
MAWLQGYYLPEHEPAVIDLEKLLSDKAKLTEHCITSTHRSDAQRRL